MYHLVLIASHLPEAGANIINANLVLDPDLIPPVSTDSVSGLVIFCQFLTSYCIQKLKVLKTVQLIGLNHRHKLKFNRTTEPAVMQSARAEPLVMPEQVAAVVMQSRGSTVYNISPHRLSLHDCRQQLAQSILSQHQTSKIERWPPSLTFMLRSSGWFNLPQPGCFKH